jgi:hypothetical protein
MAAKFDKWSAMLRVSAFHLEAARLDKCLAVEDITKNQLGTEVAQ